MISNTIYSYTAKEEIDNDYSTKCIYMTFENKTFGLASCKPIMCL